MKLKTEFQQAKLIPKDCLGICMRVTFKWLALKLAKGEFKYEKLNATKSAKKMENYGDPFIQKLCDKNFSALDTGQSQAYTMDDVASIQKYVSLWGNKVVDAQKKTFQGIYPIGGHVVSSLKDFSQKYKVAWSNFHAMYSFYMALPATSLAKILGSSKVENPKDRIVMAGHVVGISGSDNTLFDANYGEFTFDSTDPAKSILEIEDYITQSYSPDISFKRGLVILGINEK